MIDELSKFAVALIADGLDACGHPDRVLAPELRLLTGPATARFAGVAKTSEYRVLPAGDRFPPVSPAQLAAGLEQLERSLAPGDVFIRACAEDPPACGLIGELLATLFQRAGVAAVVVDGYVRDLEAFVRLGLPVVAAGTSPANAIGRIARVGAGGPVRVRGVTIENGDFVLGDADGTVVVPHDPELIARLLAWLARSRDQEDETLRFLRAGGKLSEAVTRFGRL